MTPLPADAWGSRDYLDRIDALLALGDYREVDDALVASLGDVVGGHDTRALLAGRLVKARRPQYETRGWLGAKGVVPDETAGLFFYRISHDNANR